jgi:hypothetical protein
MEEERHCIEQAKAAKQHQEEQEAKEQAFYYLMYHYNDNGMLDFVQSTAIKSVAKEAKARVARLLGTLHKLKYS